MSTPSTGPPMAGPDPAYLKLPGTGRGLAAYSKLYRGPDHLLQVTSMWTQETYKRFYYRDIQAIIIQQTGLGTFITAFCLFFAVTCLALVLAVGSGARTLPVIFAVIFATILAIHLNLGPTVNTYLRTAVQVEKLRSLSRLGKARRVVRELQPLILQAQASPTPGSATPAEPPAPKPPGPPAPDTSPA